MVKVEHEECGQGAVKLPSRDEPICNFGPVQSATSADSENKEEVKDSAIRADRTEKSDTLKTDSSGNRLEIGPQPIMNDFSESPLKSGEKELATQDPLIEVNLGSEEVKCPTYISANLSAQRQEELIKILIEYKDCFAWSYEEMPGLSREIVEHRLPIKKGFKPFKQPARRFEPSIVLKIKDEIENLLKAGFIRAARYVDWVSNIVPVRKKNGKLRVCIDFRNLNLATPKDEYPMPIADMLVDAAAGHEILSFMDGHAGYNQIFIAEEDVAKTAFRCPGSIGTFEWVVMPFGLKNAGATYQRAMNFIFHDLIGKSVEVYIDDIVVKSESEDGHWADLERAFKRMRRYHLKMNPLKCAFGVSAGNFLGFLVHQKGIEVDKNKAKAIMELPPPRSKKELQSLLGKVNYLRRFISNLAGRIGVFTPLLRLKNQEEFVWTQEQQKAFDEIKQYLANPPVLMPPRLNQPMKLYVSATDENIGCLLAQEDCDKNERAIFYLSRRLLDTEQRYSAMEKLCLALYYACTKLRYYILPVETAVVCKTDLIKYMLSKPVLRGRIGRWVLALSEFSLTYVPAKAVKGQAIADFLTEHPCVEVEEPIQSFIGCLPWVCYFDGSRTAKSAGVGIVIQSPEGFKHYFAFELDFGCSNNQAEYEALIIGLEILDDLEAKHVKVIGDSQLVIKQVIGEYRCENRNLQNYLSRVIDLLCRFGEVELEYVPRERNKKANDLAQSASGYKEPTRGQVEIRLLPSVFMREPMIAPVEVNDDWREPIIGYLTNPSLQANYQLRKRALGFCLIGDRLYKRSADEVLLKCLGIEESLKVMGEVHEGLCGTHLAGKKMRWTIRQIGYYWPNMHQDCIKYAKGCQECQAHSPVQRVPAAEMHAIIKPWPFRGWAMDLIGEIQPNSSAGHKFLIVAVDYFTKWVEARPTRLATQKDIIDFVEDLIISRFGVPETITTDQGTMFTGERFGQYMESRSIKLLHSSPYYAQANGQAEAINKVIVNLMKRGIGEHPRKWHEKLPSILWACRTSVKTATGVTPFKLVYGHEAVIPAEITISSLRVEKQKDLTAETYNALMNDALDEVNEIRLKTFDQMRVYQNRVSQAYNKKVKAKNFAENELVMKLILPIGRKDRVLGKWSPNWEGPFQVSKVTRGNAYYLQTIEGKSVEKPINGKYLKRYYPSMWENVE